MAGSVIGRGPVGRQHDGTGHGRGVGRALDPQRVDPVPGHVDDKGGHHHEQEHRAREDHDDLATVGAAAVTVARCGMCWDVLGVHRSMLTVAWG